jgi:hypothetical protein
MLRERVSATDLESAHFSRQLLERLNWAVNDAHEVEEPPVDDWVVEGTGLDEPQLVDHPRPTRARADDPRNRGPRKREDRDRDQTRDRDLETVGT